MTQSWLKQVGFASSNDRTLLGVLRQIGFLDAAGRPTETWAQYRTATSDASKRVLAHAIRAGYSGFFEMYSNAHDRVDGELEAFFRGHVSAGPQVLAKTINTFKTLVSIASFETESGSFGAARAPSDPSVVPDHLPTSELASTIGVPITPVGTPVTIAINVQLAVPETKDSAVYDAFFESMKKHLLS